MVLWNVVHAKGQVRLRNLINIQNQNNYDFLGIKNYVQKHSKQNEINNIKINVNTQINSIGEMRR